jgi:uncharacterized protein (DUF1684 family)
MIRQILLGLLLACTALSAAAQLSDWREHTQHFRDTLTAEYMDSARSPLTDEALATFHGHTFFPARKKFFVVSRLERTPNDTPFEMPTSSGITKTFVRYGIAHFTLGGKEHHLNVYRNLKLAATEEYKNHLFLPFTDETTGEETYGGGRYIDLEIPDNDELVINFNTAYNPNCAYSTGWNCPIVPRENHLPVKVKAGVKGTTGSSSSH